MDSFINLAKQGLNAYESSQGQQNNGGASNNNNNNNNNGGNVNKTGGAEFNSPHHADGGRQSSGIPDLDDDHVVQTANAHGTSDSNDLFAQGLSFIKSQISQGQSNHPVNEGNVQDAHDKAYNQGKGGSLDASSLGSAAALQALKNFTSGGGSTSSSSGGSSNGLQSKLIGMAMAEASKLFDKQGGATSGNKQDAVNGAAATVVKLLLQSKFSGAVGGSNSGGLGQLAGLANKFL